MIEMWSEIKHLEVNMMKEYESVVEDMKNEVYMV